MQKVELKSPANRVSNRLIAEVVFRAGEGRAELGNGMRGHIDDYVDVICESRLAIDATAPRSDQRIGNLEWV